MTKCTSSSTGRFPHDAVSRLRRSSYEAIRCQIDCRENRMSLPNIVPSKYPLSRHLKLQRILLRQVFVANLRLRSRVQTHVRSFPISLVAPFIPLSLLHLPDLFPRDVEKSRSLPRRIGNESIPAPIFCALAWPLNPFFHEESTCSRASELKSCCIRGNTK